MNYFLLLSVKAQFLREEIRANLKDRLSDDSGEMGSWLILAAGLVAAAVAVVGILTGFFEGKANDINNSG